MQIKIYTPESHLEEMHNFLKSDVPYEHTIEYSTDCTHLTISGWVEVSLFYLDYVLLEDFSKKFPTLP